MLPWEALWFWFLVGLLMAFAIGSLIDNELWHRRISRQKPGKPE